MSEDQASFDYLGAVLNQAILGALGHGIYTCILLFTLWTIFSSKQVRSKARKFMALIIILLYISATIFLVFNWAYVIYAYSKKGEAYATVLQALSSSPQAQAFRWVSGITSGVNTDIAGTIMIWRCWIVWGRRWRPVIIPILLFLGQAVFGCFALHVDLYETFNLGPTPEKSKVSWTTMYLSFSLGTTLLCTTLIIYRIVTVRRFPGGISAAARTYRGIVEILVVSALLYSVTLIIFIILISRGGATSVYSQIIYIPITGIAPTLIVARVASGQTRPNDSWQASGVSMLQFGSGTENHTDGILSINRREFDLEHGEPNY
ncbi:hypothetical protein IW261DRAFT_1439797 [Armillaria novae-zelandiae]|uniref:Uncharacterized protein n=1 Tax=Armillaria novae-zelandiae TaxID=153914 RepID=A0AA39PRT9_9AGAR|nr:hypothetical protein IW261DRAFT_1439797 [Armillaria novae-zelandiae]